MVPTTISDETISITAEGLYTGRCTQIQHQQDEQALRTLVWQTAFHGVQSLRVQIGVLLDFVLRRLGGQENIHNQCTHACKWYEAYHNHHNAVVIELGSTRPSHHLQQCGLGQLRVALTHAVVHLRGLDHHLHSTKNTVESDQYYTFTSSGIRPAQ